MRSHRPVFTHVRGKVHVTCSCGEVMGARCDYPSAIKLHAEHYKSAFVVDARELLSSRFTVRGA